MLKFSPQLRDALRRATAVTGRVTAWAGRAYARFRVPPRLRDTSPHGRDALTRAFAWISDFELFEVRGLGRGGISEAA